MNILITCAGRAFELTKALRTEFAKAGYGTIATANRDLMAALYTVDKAYIVPSIGDKEYIPALLEICKRDAVKTIFVYMDEDLLAISKAADQFREIGVSPMVVDYEVARVCDDKYQMYEFFVEHGFNCAATYSSLEEFKVAYSKKEVDFPVFIKPVIGAGSRGAMRCDSMDRLEIFCSGNTRLIIQEFMNGPEYSVDAYIDTISGQMVSAFAKLKIVKSNVGTGGTATGISMKDDQLFALTERLAQCLGAVGPQNIEFFNIDGDYYVGEVNPRFGGNYFFAHACGIDFVSLIINNINGIENKSVVGNYDSGIMMFRYDNMLIKKPGERLKCEGS